MKNWQFFQNIVFHSLVLCDLPRLIQLTEFLAFCQKTFLYKMTKYVRMGRGSLSACLCVCVCLSVFVWQLYSLNGWADFDEIAHNSLKHGSVLSFSDFLYLNLMTSWRPFKTLHIPHSHGSNFCPFCSNLNTMLSPRFCYWKSAKPAGNFWFYNKPCILFCAFLSPKRPP